LLGICVEKLSLNRIKSNQITLSSTLNRQQERDWDTERI